MALLAAGAALALTLGCEEKAFIGQHGANRPPTIRLTSGPPEGDTTAYRIQFSWMGFDSDGRVDFYEYVMCDGSPLGFDPSDTTGADKWRRIFRTDSTFAFSADEEAGSVVVIGTGRRSSFCQRVHTFFVRAVDNRGSRSESAYRSFTARTLAPYAVITSPVNPFPGREQQLSGLSRFAWTGEDPIDQGWKIETPESTRYFLAPYTAALLEDLNKHPEEVEDRWGPWHAYDAPGDSGQSTVIGDDEILERGYSYLFVVQAKDEAGAVTAVFDRTQNVRHFMVTKPPGPLLKVSELNLGRFAFMGANNRTQTFRVPWNFRMTFGWVADASSYGGTVSTYRYGWDIADLGDPNQWAVEASPFVTATPTTFFPAGVHTLYVEAADNLGSTTLASFEVTVFPEKMTRNLLWVDDLYSTDFIQKDYGFPTEREHDEFWTNVCRRAKDFNPDTDIYDTYLQSNQQPDIEVIYRYKNIIWSYSSADDVMGWDDMIAFVPEIDVGKTGEARFSFLGYYLSSGGHIWSEGKADQQGGLGAALPYRLQIFPRNLRCEMRGTSTGCEDTSGVTSIPYRLYCVTVLDKARGAGRRDPRMPTRYPEWDAMDRALKDRNDPITTANPGLPDTLSLWERCTRTGMYFDPKIRGFGFIEFYDPNYWMRITLARSQTCFHPMYRTKSRVPGASPLNGDVVAFWSTKYADVIADVPDAVAAPSVHFGLPLWYFDRNQVNAIADVIFKAWNISLLP